MKWLLALSISANVFLGWKLLFQPKKMPEERIIVKAARPKVIERKVYVEVPVAAETEKTLENKTLESSPPAAVEYDEQDMEDVMVKVNRDREDFLVGKLGFTPNDFQRIQDVKNRFNQRYLEVVPPDHYGDLSIEQRRQLLALDEEKEAELSRAVGEKKWKEFQKFRNEYNHQMFTKQVNDKGIIIPMEI